jgi:peroxiredoxin
LHYRSSRQLTFLLVLAAACPLMAATPPAVGDKAPDFALATIVGQSVRLSEVTAQGPTVLVVLRGYPGYQCPFCNRQAQDFIKNAQAFADEGTRVVMIYPGPGQDLGMHAREFMAGKTFPNNFDLLLDPDYKFTNLYGLRWDAPQETAYPSTFLLDRQGAVFFAKIGKEHGGRTTALEILEAFKKHMSSQVKTNH